ncbi:XVIPCD domain-containing protein [Luteimonas granuli]|uniref:Carboxypeptidase n=1 Tax=Luteimonas granuli TaxID=1176533 RepID=A0A518N4R5_9GAMM|nr:XVIPCD domain-containing protein [Luteimonas granuli]QDW66904.1 carboxypeptidase [Luteimonas granuli]
MDGHGRSTGGFGIDRDASIQLIVDTALRHGVDDHRQIAYLLATAQHETRDFSAPEEDFGRSQARKLGYSGGEAFYGRGYVHLTHDYNYRKFDDLFGLDGTLVDNPARAREPELAARILVIGMRDGLFTGRRLDRYINDGTRDAYNARRVVNGITGQAWTIRAAEDCERYARAWERSVPALIEKSRARIEPAPAAADLRQGVRGGDVVALQRELDRLGIRDGRGRPLAVDGIFGRNTRQAVENFQLWNGLDVTGVADRETRALLRGPRDPAHPDHAMYARIRAGVRALNEGSGTSCEETGERISRCLLARCKGAAGGTDAADPAATGPALRRVDHVVMGRTGHLFAIEGRLDDPAQRRAWVSLSDVGLGPTGESDRRVDGLNVPAARERESGHRHGPPEHTHLPGRDTPRPTLQG